MVALVNLGALRTFSGGLNNPEAMIPTYGNWCGPGWSGGRRIDNPNWDVGSIKIDTPTGPIDSQVDAACKIHDRAYYDAAGQPNEAQLILQADLNLLKTMRDIDPTQMPLIEQAYAAALIDAFKVKLVELDASNAASQAIKDAALNLYDELKSIYNAIPILDWMRESYQQLLLLQKAISIATNFNSAITWRPRRDPLVLDLDGDGIETVGASNTNPVLFDHDNNGVKTGTGWVKPDDGFLVMDRNGNGTIDSGAELFGDHTPLANGSIASDGFAALADLDSNNDGKISSTDASFANLRVWRDLNQDGISQANELFTLDALNIAAINVAHTNTVTSLGNGNTVGSQGTFTRTDGSTSAMDGTDMADVNLAQDTFHRQFTDTIPLAAGVSLLPNMQGSGMVRDLWEAASLSSGLETSLAAYSAMTTRVEQKAALDDLIQKWGKTTVMQISIDVVTTQTWYRPWESPVAQKPVGYQDRSGITVIQQFQTDNPDLYAKIAALEAFNGRNVLANLVWQNSFSTTGNASYVLRIFPQQIDLLQQSYDALKESVYEGLLLQTRLKPLLDMIVLAPDASGTGLVLNFTDLQNELQSRVAANTVNGMADLLDFDLATKNQLAGTSWNGWALLEQNLRTLPITTELQALYTEFGVKFASAAGGTTAGTAKRDVLLGDIAADTLNGNAGDDVLFGGAGNDSLSGGDGSDVLVGGDGNDTLAGGNGNDILDGGAGNDWVEGDAGDDTYLFGRGDGQDTLYNYDTTAGRNDVLQLKTGIASADVQLTRSGNDLLVKIVGTTDQVSVYQFFQNDGSLTSYALNAIQFSDGTNWNLATIKTLVQQGTASADNLYAYAPGDTLHGLAGSDSLTGAAGNDLLYGDDGNDTINGNAGNDTLDGGAGADTVNGGDGNDTVNGGDGNDTLSGGNGNDILDTGAGNDWVQGDAGNDTYLFGRGDGQDTLYNYDTTVGRNDVLLLKAGVATTDVQLTRSGNDLLVKIAGTTDQVSVYQFFQNDGSLTSYALNAIQFSDGTNWSLATIKTMVQQGTASADNLYAYAPGDTLHGLAGNDVLTGAAGNDALYGDDGNDTINGNAGNDTLDGGASTDTVNGGDGNDTVSGGDGNDTLSGGNGNDVLDTGAGNDWVQGDAGNDTYLFGRGDGQDTLYNYDTTAGRNDALLLKAGVATTDVQLTRSGNDLLVKIAGTSDQVSVYQFFQNDGSLTSYALNAIQFGDGTSWDLATIKTMVLQGTSGADTLTAYAVGSTLTGLAGNDTLSGGTGNDALDAGDGNDTVSGGNGNDILSGGAGNDTLTDTVGQALFNGGSGTDTLTGGSGNELFIGGTGNDSITTGSGADIIAFNKGDGQDTVAVSTTKDNTLSIGGGTTYADLLFQKSGNNLILKVGTADQITFTSYYSSTSNRSINTLQMILEGSSDYAPAAGDPLRDNKIESFNFDGLVAAFDAALVANPALTSWALSNALLSKYLSGSDTAAMGGDLAYQYGRYGNLSSISSTPAIGILGSTSFGTAAQTLQPLASLQDASLRLS